MIIKIWRTYIKYEKVTSLDYSCFCCDWSVPWHHYRNCKQANQSLHSQKVPSRRSSHHRSIFAHTVLCNNWCAYLGGNPHALDFT
ncbi:hypothetical protein FR483_n765L [Paramecium bursaria Chlorella virus FR483]|uniref:Uncharacterized protein n765L n=1 Tax=Paramecium bursaria Chlorella virus FR483 TaxID=399781 RepID=A7J8B9_PBCVF|nr:hypothetical protein FR483_n765L [Paramecium bursaria Chlorella virus FR483]ABT16050.1 hypothetical protein FR483_n765L [Paramecium bursaria Chlorella virus FR483]